MKTRSIHINIMTENQIKRLQNDLEIICERLLKELSETPKAIFLCGGYGRDEGAWYEDEYGNATPYNDYDFAIITECPLSKDANNKIREDLAKEVGIRWIDIACYSQKELKSLKPTIHNIDLLSGSKCIYGDENVLEACPQLNPIKIGFRDITILMRIRLWTFLGSWEGDFHDMDVEESRFFKNQMAKAMLSACDLYLLFYKKYTVSYKERAKLVCDLCRDDIVLCHRVEWAIHEKLHPSSDELTKEEMMNLYFEVKDLFLMALKTALKPYGCKAALEPNKLWRWIMLNTPYLLLSILSPFWRKAYLTKKSYEIFVAQLYVFYANERGRVNYGSLISAMRILNKWGYLEKGDYDWNFIRTAVSKARNNI